MKQNKFSLGNKLLVVGAVVLLVAISLSSAIPLRFGTDINGVTWIGTREQNMFADSADFIVGRVGATGVYYAINGSDGTNFSYGSFASVMNACCAYLYTLSASRETRGGLIKLLADRYNLYDEIMLTPGVIVEGSSGLRENLQVGTTIGVYDFVDAGEKSVFSYDATLYAGGSDSVAIKNIQFAAYYDPNIFSFIYLKRSLHSRIEGCKIGMGGHNTYGVYLDGAIGTFIINCDIGNCVKDGIYMNTSRSPSFLPCNDVVVRDSWVRGCGRDGIYIDEGATEVVIQGCAVVGNARYDVNMGDDTDVDSYVGGPQKCILRDCYFGESGAGAGDYANDYPSIHLCESYLNTIDSCYFNENSVAIDSIARNGYERLLDGNVISNCWFNTPTYPNVKNGKPVSLNGSGTVFENCRMPGINIGWGDYITIRNCNISNCNYGIILSNTRCNYSLIEKCRITNVNTSGISALGTGCIISGCFLKNVCMNPAPGCNYAIYGNIVEDTFVEKGSSTSFSIGGAITNSFGLSYNVTQVDLQRAIWDMNGTGGTVWIPDGLTSWGTLNIKKNVRLVGVLNQTLNNGSCQITAAATSVTVNHGLSITPTFISITPASSIGTGVAWYVDTITSTQFTLHLQAVPGLTATFMWKAEYI
jgi:hypothetical protein